MEIIIALVVVGIVAYLVLRKSKDSTVDSQPETPVAPYKVEVQETPVVVGGPENRVETPAPVAVSTPAPAPESVPAVEPAKTELKVVKGAKTQKSSAAKTPKAPRTAKPKTAPKSDAGSPAAITGGRKRKTAPKK